MTCRIDHAAELAVPAFLCRTCHPELNHTHEQNVEFYHALQQSQIIEREMQRRKYEIARTRERIAKMVARGEPDPESVAGKIYRGLCNKLARLELGEDNGDF